MHLEISFNYLIVLLFCLVFGSYQKEPDVKTVSKKLTDDQKSAVVRYHVFTSNNQNKSFEIKYDQTKVDEKLLNLSSICNSSKSLYKFIVHGFAETWNMTYRWNWVKDFIDEMLRSQEASQLCIFAVDWKELARGGTVMANYWKAIDNMLIAADLMTNFFQINKINEKNMHCIGFSLGAHMCGVFFEAYFNKFKLKPGRITGLDPAGPFFKDKPSNLKLTITDAEFVDIIHTSDKFGLPDKNGHMDFYEDAGPSRLTVCNNAVDRFENLDYVVLYEEEQKGKSYENVTLTDRQITEGGSHITVKSITSLIKSWYNSIKSFFVKSPKRVFLRFHQFFGCSHLMSVRLFLYSINNCLFKTKFCEKLTNFKTDKCFKIDKFGESYPRLGYYADRSAEIFKRSNGNFFLLTSDRPPYCNDPIKNKTIKQLTFN